MRTVYTNSLYSVEITRNKMEDILKRCKECGVINRVTLNQELKNAVLSDGSPDMIDKDFETESDAINASNHVGSIDYYRHTVPYFRVSARVIEAWVYDSNDEDCDEFWVTDISNFTFEDVDAVIDKYIMFH